MLILGLYSRSSELELVGVGLRGVTVLPGHSDALNFKLFQIASGHLYLVKSWYGNDNQEIHNSADNRLKKIWFKKYFHLIMPEKPNFWIRLFSEDKWNLWSSVSPVLTHPQVESQAIWRQTLNNLSHLGLGITRILNCGGYGQRSSLKLSNNLNTFSLN